MHADSHPGNYIWNPKTKGLIMIDFEFVSIGQAVADIATFMFMRTNPAYRKKYEREFVQTWYERLIAGGNCKAENYSWD